MLKNVMQKVEVHNSLRLDVMHSLGFNVIYTFGDFIFNFFYSTKQTFAAFKKKKIIFFALFLKSGSFMVYHTIINVILAKVNFFFLVGLHYYFSFRTIQKM